MPYVHRLVKAGNTVEHRKMQSFRTGAKKTKRKPHEGTTSKVQAKINERVAEERLRWDINANFKYRDLHTVLHYNTKDTSFQQILKDKAKFLKELRKLCKKAGVSPKMVVVVETKRMTNPHIHVVINKIDPDIIADAWENVPKGGGGVSFKPLDRRGNHTKLAHYLIKESRATMEKYKELGMRGKRYTKSQNMKKPEVIYQTSNASSWRKEPKARKGAFLYKFDDGSTQRAGIHEATGWPYQEYFEIFDDKEVA